MHSLLIPPTGYRRISSSFKEVYFLDSEMKSAGYKDQNFGILFDLCNPFPLFTGIRRRCRIEMKSSNRKE